MSRGTLIAFAKGRHRPRRTVLAKLEKVLNWSPGTITRSRDGACVAPGGETTEVLTDTARAPLMAEVEGHAGLTLYQSDCGDQLEAKPGRPGCGQQTGAALSDPLILGRVCDRCGRLYLQRCFPHLQRGCSRAWLCPSCYLSGSKITEPERLPEPTNPGGITLAAS